MTGGVGPDRSLRRRLRSALKAAYMALPMKPSLFGLLRRVYVPPKAIWRYLYFRGPFEVREEGARFRVMHYGFEVETSIYWTGLTGSWEGRSLSIWLKLCRDAQVICDVGANTGIYALAAKAVNRNASVFAFEPVSRVFEKLESNCRLNGFDITCVNSALSDREGEAVLYDLPQEHVYAVMLDKDLHTSESIPVTVRTERLDAFAKRHALERVDLLKIDVESHEPQVLRGIGRDLLAGRPSLIVEVWNDEIGSRIEDAVDGLGYDYYAIEKQGARRAAHVRHSGPGYVNFLICSPEVACRIGVAEAR